MFFFILSFLLLLKANKQNEKRRGVAEEGEREGDGTHLSVEGLKERFPVGRNESFQVSLQHLQLTGQKHSGQTKMNNQC